MCNHYSDVNVGSIDYSESVVCCCVQIVYSIVIFYGQNLYLFYNLVHLWPLQDTECVLCD